MLEWGRRKKNQKCQETFHDRPVKVWPGFQDSLTSSKTNLRLFITLEQGKQKVRRIVPYSCRKQQ